MAFLTGVLLIDAPSAALNNSGAESGSRDDNAVAVKAVKSPQGVLPYVSAQSVRYWLRSTLEQRTIRNWKTAPVFREQKVAYTDSNPIEWCDDDLFGYMRAQSKKTEARERRSADLTRSQETVTTTDITRVSPLRLSTFLSLAPVTPTQDFGTMSRHEGAPVPHQHQFYHAILRGLLSIDLHAAGTFSYRDRTGFRNLDDTRKALADSRNLEHLIVEQSYRLPFAERANRVAALLDALGVLAGGAKQAIHYTDVTPVVVLAMITRGGNNPLHYVVGATSRGLPEVREAALDEMFRVWGDQVMSPLYVGWTQGFHDDEHGRLLQSLERLGDVVPHGFVADHPREVLKRASDDLTSPSHSDWMD